MSISSFCAKNEGKEEESELDEDEDEDDELEEEDEDDWIEEEEESFPVAALRPPMPHSRSNCLRANSLGAYWRS